MSVRPFPCYCLVIGALWLLAAARSDACSCVQRTLPLDEDIRQFLASGDKYRPVAVFRGRVEQIEKTERRKRVTFSVSTWWKGGADANVAVETGLSDADCGYPFVVGEEYIVYATRYMGGPWCTSICLLTDRVNAYHLASLKAGIHPSRTWIGPVVVLLVLLGLALWGMRKPDGSKVG